MDSHMSLDACKNKKKCEFDFMHALSIIHYALWENSVSTQSDEVIHMCNLTCKAYTTQKCSWSCVCDLITS